ncbi:TPA: DEAD/DEAH box helicase [Candidatus Bathyarchaeota archaeon]|nr:DEAD/DEAH box helicase [Candidatus Bathyarchaeota archaeon]
MKIETLDIPEEAKRIIIKSGIINLYPPQIDAIRAGALNGKNVVLASPTASGKTLVAELCAMKHALEYGGKTLYLTPLRALASEKYQEFKKYTSISKVGGDRVRVGISTGDYDSSDPWLGRYDIIVVTNEKLDSLLRHKAPWIEEISLVVADEVHLINDVDRGPTLEVVLARLQQVNPDIQILALSATIRNSDEIAEWLDAIPVTTDWRPIKLREGVLLGDEIQFKDGGAIRIKKKVRTSSINLALHILELGGQALIFASTRKSAVALAKKAAPEVNRVISRSVSRALKRVAETILTSGEKTRMSELLADLVKRGVAFHHAGLYYTHRRIIEDAFREGKIKVLTATPTLAFGVNLPARMVIIHSYRRYEPGYGYYPITVLEYKQMIGRAGRPKYDPVGESVLVARTEEERDFLFESYILAQPERIWSKLGVEKVLRSHVLATVASEFARSERGLYDFFIRTFYAYQYDIRAMKGLIARVLRFLYKERMIDINGEDIYATRFGRRISQLYIDPVSAIIVRDALQQGASKLTDLSFLHMIAHTPDLYPKLRVSSKELDRIALFAEEHRDEFMFEMPDEWTDRLTFEEFLGEVKTSWVLRSWIEEASEDSIIEAFEVEPGDLYRLIEASRWLLYASSELALLLGHKDVIPRLSRLRARVRKGVKPELLPLARLEGIGRVRARILFDAGFKNVEDLKRAPLQKLISLPLIGPAVAKKIKEQVGGLVKLEEWETLMKKKTEQQALTEYTSMK